MASAWEELDLADRSSLPVPTSLSQHTGNESSRKERKVPVYSFKEKSEFVADALRSIGGKLRIGMIIRLSRCVSHFCLTFLNWGLDSSR